MHYSLNCSECSKTYKWIKNGGNIVDPILQKNKFYFSECHWLNTKCHGWRWKNFLTQKSLNLCSYKGDEFLKD